MAVTPNRHSRSVYILMQIPVWSISAVNSGGPSTGVGGGTMGSPEHVPELTFIAVPTPNDNGFIAQATQYHQTYGLNPTTVNSIEHLVQLLAATNTSLSRIRLVSHVFFPDPGDPPSPTNMNLVFFNGQPRGAGFPEAWFYKFGISDNDGLNALLQNTLENHHNLISTAFTVPINNNNGTATLDRATILALRNKYNSSTSPTIDSILGPFNLAANNSPPATGNLALLIQLYTDLFAIGQLQNVNLEDDAATSLSHPLNTTQKGILTTFINQRIDTLQLTLVTATRTVADMQNLGTEIANLSLSDFPVGLAPFQDFTLYTQIEHHFFQDHSVFRANLAIVRNRFSSDSFIDIRGCRVANDSGLEYLNALRSFFGNSGNEPTVTGPDWFQSFPSLGSISCPSEDNIDQVFNNGTAGLSSNDVRREFSNWSERIGIPTHLAFFSNLMNGNALNFINMDWKRNLPQLNMEPIQYDGFEGLSFSETIRRLAAIFDIPNNQRPTDAELTNMDTVFQLSQQTTFPNPTATITELSNMASSLGVTVSGMPTPTTLDIASFINAIDQLKAAIAAHGRIIGLMSAINQKLTAPTAGIRYMLFIGLPLMVQDSTAGSATNVRLIFLQNLEQDSIRSFMRAQWAKTPPLPTGIMANDTTVTFNGTQARQVAAVTDDRANTNFAVNPTFQYSEHIKSVP